MKINLNQCHLITLIFCAVDSLVVNDDFVTLCPACLKVTMDELCVCVIFVQVSKCPSYDCKFNWTPCPLPPSEALTGGRVRE